MAEVDPQKLALAKRAAVTMFATMAGVDAGVQLEAAILLLKSIFMANVKATHRLSLFNSVVIRMREEIKHHLKTGKVP